MEGQTPRRTWKRRLLRALTLGLIVILGLVAALPWLVGTPPARSALVKAINRALAPSRLELKGLSASWIGSIRLTGLKLTDRSGKTLIDARSAATDRGLLALALHPRQLGTITVDGATIDIERRGDGSIDLVDALIPPKASKAPAAAKPDPPTKPAAPAAGPDVTLRLVGSSLTLRTPELAEPLVAGHLDLEAHVPAASEPLSWRIRLAEPPGGLATETLGVDGSFDHNAAADPDLSLTVQGARWPLAVAGASLGADVAAHARLDGQLHVERKAARWAATGDAKLLDVDATGAALNGDRLRLDRIAATWNLEQTATSWTLRQARVTSPVGDLFGRGDTGAASHRPTARLEANVDLAALAHQLPHMLRIREGLNLDRGTARVTADLSSEGTTQKVAVDAWLSDLAARDKAHAFTLRDPAALSARATRTATGFSVQTLTAKAATVDLKGSGDLEKGITLSGSVDLAGIQEQFHDLIDFGNVKLAGKARMAADFRPSKTSARAGYLARYAAEVRGLQLVGLTDQPLTRDAVRFDAAASGPADPSGLPLSVENARVNLKSSVDTVTLSAITKGDATALSAVVSLPFSALPTKVVERDGQLGAKFSGRWTASPALLTIDELNLSAVPADPKLAADGTVNLRMAGRVEVDADNLILTPVAGPAPHGACLTLGPKGLRLHGVRSTPLTDRAGKLELVGDIAALDRAKSIWMNEPPTELAGALSIQLALASGGPGKVHLGGQVQLPDLSRVGPNGKGRRPEGPLTLTVSGAYEPAADRFTLDECEAATRYANVSATGRLEELSGRLVADLAGTLAPVWPNVTKLAAEMVEPGMVLTGGARPFHVKGPLTGTSLAATLKGLDAELGLDLASADAFGLKLGPAPLVLRCSKGAATIDPISTTLNGGRVELEPGLDVDESRGIALLLDNGSSIHDASINDEVSKRLLRYVAPVLDDATHVNGKITLTVDKGEFPLVAPPERKVNMTGALAFQDVIFAPGPFASQVLTLAGKSGTQGLKLQQPVQLSVADGRVVQKGLEIPVNRDATIGLEGSVGFDQTLDMRASVPLTGAMLGQAAGLDKFVSGKRVVVPIGGTVKQPRINRQALQVALKELSKGTLKRELSDKASDLLNQLAPAAGAPGRGTRGDPLKGLENQLLKRLAPRRPAAAPAAPAAPDSQPDS